MNSARQRVKLPIAAYPSIVDRTNDQLRFGVLLDSMALPLWQSLVLDELDRVAGLRCVVVGVNAVGHDRPRLPDLWSRRRLAWTVYNRVTSKGCPALAATDESDRLEALPQVKLDWTPDGAWQTINSGACSELAAHRPDFLLRFGFGLINGPILTAAPLGVWSFHHGDERLYRGGPPCFWELADGNALTGVLLQRLNERIDGGVPLARASFATVPHSYRRNRSQSYLGAVELPAQVCRRILAGDTDVTTGPASESVAPVRRPPDGRTLASFLPRLAGRWLRRQFDGLTKSDRWHIGVVHRPIHSFVDDQALADVEWLPRPKGSQRYVADPFGCRVDGDATVLVEDFDHTTRHGTLSAYRLDSSGRFRGPLPVKTLGVHTSYPYLVRVADDWWCIPETSAAADVRAYEFDPTHLTLDEVRVLLTDVALADPTVFHWEDRWWLFGTDRTRGANTHLRAWWADHPTAEWRPHAVDPLAIDIQRSRGAGTPFVHEGALYRPTQDCSRSYGGAVMLNRVNELTPTRFREEPVAVVRPHPGSGYPDGVHTLSGMGDMTLVDGTRHRFSSAAFRHELDARLRRLPARRP